MHALFLLKDTFKETCRDPDVFEKSLSNFYTKMRLNWITPFQRMFTDLVKYYPRVSMLLINDILNKEEEELSAKER